MAGGRSQQIAAKISHDSLFHVALEPFEIIQPIAHQLRVGQDSLRFGDHPGAVGLALNREFFHTGHFDRVHFSGREREQMPIPQLGSRRQDRVQNFLGHQNNIRLAKPAGINDRRIIGGTLAELHHHQIVGARAESQFRFRRLQAQRLQFDSRIIANKLLDPGRGELNFLQNRLHFWPAGADHLGLGQIEHLIGLVLLNGKASSRSAHLHAIQFQTNQVQQRGIAPIVHVVRQPIEDVGLDDVDARFTQ